MGGSGGNSGTLSFPEYIQHSHRWLLSGAIDGIPEFNRNLETVVNTRMAPDLSGNPFALAHNEFTDPTQWLLDLHTDLLDLFNSFDDYNRSVDLAARLGYAVSAVESTGLDQKVGFYEPTDTILPDVRNQSEDVLEDLNTALAGLITGSDVADWEAWVDAVKTKLDALGFGDVDIVGILENVADFSRSWLEDVLPTINAVLDEDLIADLVASFSAGQDLEKARTVRGFTSGMADVNAVQTSAFVFGLGQIYAEYDAATLRFQADTRKELLQQALQSITSVHSAQISAAVQASVTNAQLERQLVSQAVGTILQAKQGDLSYKQAFMQTFTTLFSDLFRNLAASQREADARRGAVYAQEAQHLLQYDMGIMDAWLRSAHTRADALRQRVVMTHEYEGTLFDLDLRFADWDLSTLERAANVLAAPSGMAGLVPPTPTKTQTALSGALSGAGAGAAIGTAVGGPAGAGVGAGIGAAFGLIGGLL